MKMITKLLSGIILAVGLVFTAQADDRFGTPDQAKAMSIAAASLIKEKGIEAASVEFQDKSSKWHDRDLYVFVEDIDGNMLAHGAKPSLVGKNLLPLKDPTGFAFVKDGILKVVGEGWVDYHWQNPVTKKVAPKTSYIVVLDERIFVGVGAYK